jgi:hypothetical protein
MEETKMASIKFTGSEKQIAWANDIINGAMRTIDANIALFTARKQETGWSGYDKTIRAYEQVKTDYEGFVAKLDGTEAKTVIENRYRLDSNIAKMVEKAERQQANKAS